MLEHCCSLLQGIIPIQGSNPGLPHCRRIFLPSETPGKPKREVYPLWVLRDIHNTPQEATRGGQGRVQTERAHALMGVFEWGSGAEARSAPLNQKSEALVSPAGVISEGHLRYTGAGRHRRRLTQKEGWWAVTAGLPFAGDSGVSGTCSTSTWLPRAGSEEEASSLRTQRAPAVPPELMYGDGQLRKDRYGRQEQSGAARFQG